MYSKERRKKDSSISRAWEMRWTSALNESLSTTLLRYFGPSTAVWTGLRIMYMKAGGSNWDIPSSASVSLKIAWSRYGRKYCTTKGTFCLVGVCCKLWARSQSMRDASYDFLWQMAPCIFRKIKHTRRQSMSQNSSIIKVTAGAPPVCTHTTHSGCKIASNWSTQRCQ